MGAAVLVVAPLVAGEHPHDLELVAVGVGAVDALGGAVAGLAGVGARVEQRVAGVLELVDRVDLPGQVVEPDAAAPLGAAVGPTPNRPRSWWLPERGSRRNAALARGSRAATAMPKTSAVEALGAVQVGDEQDGVVETNRRERHASSRVRHR